MIHCTVDPDTFKFRCEACGALHPHYANEEGEATCQHACPEQVRAELARRQRERELADTGHLFDGEGA